MNAILGLLHEYFHNETNDNPSRLRMNPLWSRKENWPESWKTIQYKKYVLYPPVKLPQTESPFFRELLSSRRSSEGYILGNKVSLQDLAVILQCGYGLQIPIPGKEKREARTVPSAGQRYPLELYLILFRDGEESRAGVYHYGVSQHQLEPIIFGEISEEEILSFTFAKWLTGTKGMICITSVFERVVEKYGSRGYRYMLLEAGHVAQNMLLAGTERGVNMIPIGACYEEPIEKKIGLISQNERLLYTLFF